MAVLARRRSPPASRASASTAAIFSVFQRDFHAGSHYLVGSQFVRFLADRYGEDKLWKLIHVQARSIFFPLCVNLRFWQAYDKTLSTLIDEFADEVAADLPDRAPPAASSACCAPPATTPATRAPPTAPKR